MNSSPPPVLDIQALRAEFPALQQEVNGHPLIYLDSGATTQKPQVVLDAVQAYYRRDNANIHRGVHTLSQRATQAYEGARATVASFIGAPQESSVVFTRGTTEAINLVAHSFLRPRLQPGDRILVTQMEHHANIVPWQLVAAELGAELLPIPMDDAGVLDLDAAAKLMTPSTRMLAMVHVSNALGTINPVRELVSLAQDRGIPTLVDGAQAVAHVPVDLSGLGCDFYCFSGHKIYGPTGIGALVAPTALLASMPPYQGGGDMIRSVSFEGTTFAPPPARFEAGTPNIAGALGLGAALDWFQARNPEAIFAHEGRVLAQGTALLQSLDGLRLVGTAPNKTAVLSFLVDGIHPHDLGTILDDGGVAIRAGHHCAQPVMTRLGIPATARASLGAYTTASDMERLTDAIVRAQEMFA